MQKKIILASASPRRKEILEMIGIDFQVIPSDYHEDMTLDMNYTDLVMHLAYNKAKNVADQNKESIVIGADIFVVCDNQILGKPHTKEKAVETLKFLSGKSHYVISGIAVIDTDTDEVLQTYTETTVYFREITDAEINSYIEKNNVLDKAGAYAIQEMGSIFVERIEGDVYGVIGLPVFPLYKMLTKLGVQIL